MLTPARCSLVELASALEPVTLEEAKDHLRLPQDFTAEDTFLLNKITSARQAFERLTGYQLLTATWDAYLDAFPCDGPITLPRRPLQTVDEVKYFDTAGIEQTWDDALYEVLTFAGPRPRPGLLFPAHGESFPETAERPGAVKVRLTAGYGDKRADVPREVRDAVLLLLTHIHEHREPVLTGPIQSPLPFSLQGIIESFRGPVLA